MPDAAYYCREYKILRNAATKIEDPLVAQRLRSLAEDYRAIAALLEATARPAPAEHVLDSLTYAVPEGAKQS